MYCLCYKSTISNIILRMKTDFFIIHELVCSHRLKLKKYTINQWDLFEIKQKRNRTYHTIIELSLISSIKMLKHLRFQ